MSRNEIPSGIGDREARMVAKGKARILATGDFVPYDELVTRFTGRSTLSHWMVEVWEMEQRTFSIRNGGRVLYPTYAFTSQGEPLPGLRDIIKILSKHKEGWGLAFWLGSSNSFLRGMQPKHLLLTDLCSVLDAAGEEVSGVLHG